jgi:serine/threonine protein kinase
LTTDELVAGTRLGDYRIERLLGRGAMGQVYVATRLSVDRPVALKVLAPELTCDPAIVARFVREGRAAARLRHDHVAEIYDVGTADDVTYLAMELLEGEPLSQRFARGPLPPEALASLMLPVLAAVATAHEMGLVHRDLKPDNVFMRRDAQGLVKPVVLDFGISKVIEDALPHPIETRPLIGTPYYVSPEQARGVKLVTSAADQYALGVLMYEGVTGRRPFDGPSRPELVRNIIAGVFPRPELVNPAVPKTLANVIVRAMSLDTMSRFTSAWAMGAMLLPVASTHAQETWREVFARKTGGFAAANTAERLAGAHAVATAEAAATAERGRRRSRAVPVAVGLVAAALVAWLFLATRAKPGVALPTTSSAAPRPSTSPP